MADANGLVEAMKRAALDAMEAGKPVHICFGKVTGISPLEIHVEQKMILGEGQLVLARHVTDFETEVTVGWETEPVDIDMSHSHEGSVEVSVSSTGSSGEGDVSIQNTVDSSMTVERAVLQDTHRHTLTGRKRVTVHNALAVGDEVILARKQGGQQYIVLDRIGGAL